MARLTIGVPVFNGEAYLESALDSLLAQTFDDFELVISDNASTDSTADICRRYAERDPRVRYVRQSENIGALPNFEAVLEHGRSPYFMWAAADDLWSPTYAERCVRELVRQPEIDLCFSRYWVVSRRIPVLRMRRFPAMEFVSDPDPYVRVRDYLLMPEPSHKANLLYGVWRQAAAREFVDIYHRYIGWENFRYGGDSAQLACILAGHRAFQIPDPLFFKTYSWLPPGHLVGVVLKLPRLAQGWPARKRSATEKHLRLVESILRAEGRWDERLAEVTKEKLAREDYSRLPNVWRMIRTSRKLGLH